MGKSTNGPRRWTCWTGSPNLALQRTRTAAAGLNLHRPHLDESRRATVAAKVKPQLEAEAKERSGSRTDLRPDLPTGQNDRAREQAAALLNVSPRLVESASRVPRDGGIAF